MADPEILSFDNAHDLDMTEVDGVLLGQLLEEFEIDVARDKQLDQSSVEGESSPTAAMVEDWDKSIKDALVQDFSWIDEITDMNPVIPTNETIGWYTEDMAGRVFDFKAEEDTGYDLLWDDD